MTKQNYNNLKQKEAQIERLKERIRAIENGKIKSVNIRLFSPDKGSYEDVTEGDIPKREIRLSMLQNLTKQLEDCQKDWESYFDDECIFEKTKEKDILCNCMHKF